MSPLSRVLAPLGSKKSKSSKMPKSDDALIGKSALERLPPEIQQKIYGYLLEAECVRQPYNHHQIDSYRFQANILRVSKTVHANARAVLYNKNCFVLVRYNCPAILPLLCLFEVGIVCAKSKIVNKFACLSMVVTLKIPWSWLAVVMYPSLGKQDNDQSLLLVQNDLEGFVHMLQVFYLLNHDSSTPSYLTFDFPLSPAIARSIQIERSLLEPFRELTQNVHIVKVLHPNDISFAEDLVQQMMFPIRWERMAAWRFYDEMVAIKVDADLWMLRGQLDRAFLKYDMCLKFLHLGSASLMARRNEKDGFVLSCRRLMFTCKIDLLLLHLKGKAWDHGIQNQDETRSAELVLKRTRSFAQRGPHITTEAGCKQHYYRGVACSMIGRMEDAQDHFRAALRLDPENSFVQLELKMISYGLRPRGCLLQYQTTGIPPPTLHPSAEIASERYLLSRLHYDGDMLNDIPATRPADTPTMDYIARQYQGELQVANRNMAWDKWIKTEEVGTTQVPKDTLAFGDPVSRNTHQVLAITDRVHVRALLRR
ncbi:MAG: hypothetical protein Q9167_003203 [Letrouitia subvulpina]